MMLLNTNQESLDNILIDVIAEEFVRGNEHRLSQFGHFLFLFRSSDWKSVIATQVC